MTDEIKVHVVKYPDRANLVMRYVDPFSGRQVQRSTKTTNKRDADKAAGKWEAELNEGRYKKQCYMTWEEFTEAYRSEKLAALAEATAEAAETSFNHVARVVKPARLAEMNTARLAELQRRLRDEGMKETTIATHLRQLRAALSWAVRRGYLRIMPTIEMPKRAEGISKAMRGRAITGEELDRMIAKVPDMRKREPEKWKQLLRGLNLSGLRLSEALALSWDDGEPISVCTAGKYPALRIRAEAEKAHRDRLLPVAPEFAEFMLAIPKAKRHGLVFGIYGEGNQPLSTKRASRYISAIGKAAKVVIDKATEQYATAHDLRRSFGSRWAKRVMPAVLKDLMRHADISTTMKYYVDQSADDVGDVLRLAIGTKSGTNDQNSEATTSVDIDANGVRINT
jgi:integrase